jgi:hypothetical protein
VLRGCFGGGFGQGGLHGLRGGRDGDAQDIKPFVEPAD